MSPCYQRKESGNHIELDQENGRQRFESKLEVLKVRAFDCLDLMLEAPTQHLPPERVGRQPQDGKTLDFYAASKRGVPANDRYLLVYTLQPGNTTLDNKQVLGDRIHTYGRTAYFEMILYTVLANGLRKIHQAVKEKGANARIKLPGEKEHKPVNEGLISDLYDPRAIEEMRRILGEEAENVPDEDLVPVVFVATPLS